MVNIVRYTSACQHCHTMHQHGFGVYKGSPLVIILVKGSNTRQTVLALDSNAVSHFFTYTWQFRVSFPLHQNCFQTPRNLKSSSNPQEKQIRGMSEEIDIQLCCIEVFLSFPILLITVEPDFYVVTPPRGWEPLRCNVDV